MFIQIIQGRCTRQDEMRATATRWPTEIGPTAMGWLGGTFGFTDDDVFLGVVRFESKELAMANSERPEQAVWWAEMEKLFDGPVEFHDCSDVTVLLDGGSDDAGFVQVIRGRTDDPDALRSMMQDTDMLPEARPDLVGATLAIEDDGTFTQTIAFTDEASARAGEAQEMPVEVREPLESAMKDARYFDLHHPWFASPS